MSNTKLSNIIPPSFEQYADVKQSVIASIRETMPGHWHDVLTAQSLTTSPDDDGDD